MPARRKGSEVHKAKEALRAFCCPETGAQTVCGQSITGVSIEVQTEKVEQPIVSAERTKEMDAAYLGDLPVEPPKARAMIPNEHRKPLYCPRCKAEQGFIRISLKMV